MKFYLTARYSRREELCEYRKQLEAMGHSVTSRWLDGWHQIGDSGVSAEQSVALHTEFAKENLSDLKDADILLAFTEQPRTVLTRGGRHVDLGIALGSDMPVIVVGPRENIHYWSENCEVVGTWDQAKAVIESPWLKTAVNLLRLLRHVTAA